MRGTCGPRPQPGFLPVGVSRLLKNNNMAFMREMTALKTDRDVSLDCIRLVAIFMVICIHVSAKGFPLLNERHWWAVNAYESLSRMAVPLFFMVTGALLLPRESTVSSILKRLWRIGVPLFAWSVLYLAWFKYTGTDFDAWIARILKAPVVAHLWYLYTLLGAYLFLPVMAGFFQANTTKTLLFVMGAWLVGATLVPTVFFITQQEYVGINWGFLSLYAGYIVLGAVLYGRVQFKRSWTVPALLVWFGSTAAIAVLTWVRSVQVAQGNETFYAYTSPFVALAAAAAFLLLKEYSGALVTRSPTLVKALKPLSRVNFGVYLVHVMVLFALDIRGFDYNFINPWIGIPVVTVAAFLISAAIVALLQKIPVVRAIVPA